MSKEGSTFKKHKKFKLPFSSSWLGRIKGPPSLGFSLVPVYGAISCLFGVLYVSLLSLRHLGIKSRIANSNIMHEITAAMDIHTILFVREDFLALEFDSSVVDGPSACFAGRLPAGGGF